MNWKRGLYRVWIIGSIIWIGYWVWNIIVDCSFTYARNQPALCQDPRHGNWATLLSLAVVCLSGPLVVLAIGHILNWVRKGFR